MNDMERQLWIWLARCEEGKPRCANGMSLHAGDQVVPFLQYGVREGGEAGEVVDPGSGVSLNLQ